jgi:hypothetical protein
LNGEKSSFADVIAPYMLLQAKHTSDDVVTVDIANELRKCCLLKSCKDDRVLRGLLALWRGNLMFKGKGATKLAVVDHQASKAYPENLVKYGTPSDVVDYASIGTFETEIAWEDERLALPTFATQETMVFVLSTNAKVINAASLDLKIEQTVLGDNLQLDLSR